MAHEVWYALHYNKNDPPVLDKVRVDGDISDLKQALFNDNIRLLSACNVDKTVLKVYPVGTDITTINASTPTIELDTPTSTLVTTARQPVIVVARAPTPIQSGVILGAKPTQ